MPPQEPPRAPASSPCQAPPGHWDDEQSAARRAGEEAENKPVDPKTRRPLEELIEPQADADEDKGNGE